MQKVHIVAIKLSNNGTFSEEEIDTVVASTKSLNNEIDYLKENGYIPRSIKTEDFYIDDIFPEISKVILQKYDESTVEHVRKALFTACALYKENKRKKN